MTPDTDLTSLDASMRHLLQLDIMEEVLPRIGKEQWQVLYKDDRLDPRGLGLWCALLEPSAADTAMGSDSWDLLVDQGMPSFSQGWSSGEKVTTYHRFGSSDGAIPLLYNRSFHGAFPEYMELNEEFRHYHNLAEDRERRLLLDFDGSGREIEVARFTERQVEVSLKYLRRFQAGTGLYLAIYFDSTRFSRMPLADVPEEERELATVESSVRWTRWVNKCDFKKGFETFSRLLGKVVLAPPPQGHAGVWPFDEEGGGEKEVTFIVGVDSIGNEIKSTSNHDKLANYFGANPDACHYLTPVYFRREVLQKYYSEPARYRVADGRLSCLSLWTCRIDNDLGSNVVVFLGDLGRDLPYEERLHWRAFNVPPERGVSETSYRRGFLGEFADAKATDLVFRREYENFAPAWEAAQGWPLFLPLAAEDAHLLQTVRVPVSSAQSEFDEQVITLTKLLVDSLNESELKKRVRGPNEKAKGLGKLAAFLDETGFQQREWAMGFLKDLQNLRSTGSAHRKGKNYQKVIGRLGIQLTKKGSAFEKLLQTAVDVLRALRIHYCSGDVESRAK